MIFLIHRGFLDGFCRKFESCHMSGTFFTKIIIIVFLMKDLISFTLFFFTSLSGVKLTNRRSFNAISSVS